MRTTSLAFSIVACGVIALTAAFAQKQAPTKKLSFEKQVKSVLAAKCVSCHSGEHPADGVDFGQFKTDKDAAPAGPLWRKAAREVEKNHMPPMGSKALTEKEKTTFLTWVKESFPKAK